MRIGSVEFEKVGRIVVLTLDEPTKLNAISLGIRQGVTEGLARIDADPDVRVGILTGRGDKAFCAGADISSFPETPEQARDFIAGVLPVLEAPERCRKPLIAAVEGWCLGAGAELMMCADMVVAGSGARIGLPETNLGIMPGAGGTARQTKLPTVNTEFSTALLMGLVPSNHNATGLTDHLP